MAYATKYGATAEIAEKIGQVLRQAGLQTDVLPADRVSDLSPYRAVILGSAVYMFQWRKEAARFLKPTRKHWLSSQCGRFQAGLRVGKMAKRRKPSVHLMFQRSMKAMWTRKQRLWGRPSRKPRGVKPTGGWASSRAPNSPHVAVHGKPASAVAVPLARQSASVWRPISAAPANQG